MKAQSAIEFLTTYGFLLIILAAAILIVFFLTASTKTEIKAQCVSFSSITCNFMDFYSAMPAGTYLVAQLGYSIAAFSITNSQNAPINVTSLVVTFKSKTYTGICSPNFLYQGQEATCIANITGYSTQGNPVQGFFTVNALFCNSPVSAPTSNCTSPASYSGSFYAYVEPTPVSIFSVIAAVGNTTSQLPAYNSVPTLSPSYTVVNNGDWTAKQSGNPISGTVAYAQGTTGWTGNYFGLSTTPFPTNLYYLDNNAISCSGTYNSTISYAYTAIYLNMTNTVSFGSYADNAIAIWYKPKGSNTWNSVYGSADWPVSSVNVMISGNVILSKGLNSVAVEWVDDCGPGLQAVSIASNAI